MKFCDITGRERGREGGRQRERKRERGREKERERGERERERRGRTIPLTRYYVELTIQWRSRDDDALSYARADTLCSKYPRSSHVSREN